MSKALKNAIEANYKSYKKYYDDNKKDMSINENIKCFAKLKRLEEIYKKEKSDIIVGENYIIV